MTNAITIMPSTTIARTNGKHPSPLVSRWVVPFPMLIFPMYSARDSNPQPSDPKSDASAKLGYRSMHPLAGIWRDRTRGYAEDVGIEPTLVSPRLRLSKPTHSRSGNLPLTANHPDRHARNLTVATAFVEQRSSALPEATVEFSRNSAHVRRRSLDGTLFGSSCHWCLRTPTWRPR